MQAAQAAIERIRKAISVGRLPERYPYGITPLGVQMLQTPSDPQGNVLAVVTRNQCGSVGLNASRVMFVDMDFPESGAEAPASFFARLFGRGEKKSLESKYEQYEQKARAAGEEFVAARPGWNVYLYRAFGGLQGVATHQLFDPASSQTQEILEGFGGTQFLFRSASSRNLSEPVDAPTLLLRALRQYDSLSHREAFLGEAVSAMAERIGTASARLCHLGLAWPDRFRLYPSGGRTTRAVARFCYPLSGAVAPGLC